MKKAWFIWFLASVFYLYELVLRVSPSVMTNELVQSFNVTATSLGILVSFYYYAYTILQLPCGVILDRLGPKTLLCFSALLCAIGSILFAATNILQIAQLGRFLVGAGSACAFISCLQIAATMFSPKYFVILGGATNMMGTLGGLLGGYPVAKAVNTFGWVKTTFILAAIGLILCALIFIFFPSDEKKQKVQNGNSIIKNIFVLTKNSQILLSSMIASLMYLPVCAFAELWAVPYFMQKYDVGNEQASISSATVFLGVAIGSVLMAFIANKIRNYVKTIKLSAIFCCLLFLILLFSSLPIYLSIAILFFIGLLTGAQPICFTCAKINASPELSGTTLALTNCIVMLIGSIFQPFLGYLLDLCWNNKLDTTGNRIYDIVCYNHAILIIPIGLFIAYILSIFVKDKYVSDDEQN